MKSNGKKLSLTSYDDLFTTEDTRQEDQRERVMEIPLDKLQHFHDHPFQVRHDQALQDMADSIKEYGVLSPGLARPLPDGSGYEVISGNRRLEACILAGMETMPVIVRDMTDDEAIIAMVDVSAHFHHSEYGGYQAAVGKRRVCRAGYCPAEQLPDRALGLSAGRRADVLAAVGLQSGGDPSWFDHFQRSGVRTLYHARVVPNGR